MASNVTKALRLSSDLVKLSFRFWLWRESLVHIGMIAYILRLGVYIKKNSSLVSLPGRQCDCWSDPAPPDLTVTCNIIARTSCFCFLKQNTTDANDCLSFNKRPVLSSTVQVSAITWGKLVDVPVGSTFTAGQTMTVQGIISSLKVLKKGPTGVQVAWTSGIPSKKQQHENKDVQVGNPPL